MEWFSTWSIWLIFGFGLLILEILIPGVFIIWWGAAAIMIAGLTTIFPSLGLAWQMILFTVISSAFSLVWWKYQHRKDIQEDLSTELNARHHSMIGLQGNIIEILDNGIARGKFGDTTWRVAGDQFKVGDIVEVKSVEGITLLVKTIS